MYSKTSINVDSTRLLPSLGNQPCPVYWDPVNGFNHTSWVAVVTLTDRPKSVRNRCVIEVYGDIFGCHVAFWMFLWV